MNWKQVVLEILSRGATLQEIADECGFASPGAVHDLKSGRAVTCTYERGVRLVAMHKRVLRRPVMAA